MALRIQSKRFYKHRSVNDLSDLKRIKDDELNSLTNFEYVPAANGEVHLEMRRGFSLDTMTAPLVSGTAINGMMFAEFTGGNNTIFAYGTNIYRNATTPVDIDDGATVPSTMHDFEIFQDKLIIAAASTALREVGHNGTVAAVGGTPTPPEARYLHSWHNSLFAVLNASRTLEWTNIDDRTDWPTANARDFQGGEITGINSQKDDFYIFLKNEMWILNGFTADASSGDFDFVFKEFAKIGCISHFGIVSNGSSLFFPAPDGFYALGAIGATAMTVGGSSLIKLGSERISTFLDTLDFSTIGLIHGVHDQDNHRVIWSVRRQGQSINDRVVFFDYDENVLGFGFGTLNASCFTLGKDSNGKFQVLFGDSQTDANGGRVYKIDTSDTDNGTAIEGTIITKAYDFGKPETEKRFQTVDILAKSDDSECPIDVYYGVGDYPDFTEKKTVTTQALNQYDSGLYYDDGNYYVEGSFNNYPVAIRRTGKALNIKLISNTSGKRARIAGWTVNGQVLAKKLTSEV